MNRNSAGKEVIWNERESEHMFIHMGGGGMSESDYKCLEWALRDGKNRARITTLDVLKKQLSRFRDKVEDTQIGGRKGAKVKDLEELVLERLESINKQENLNLDIEQGGVSLVIGEGGDTFGDSKGIIQDMKVFAVRCAIRKVLVDGEVMWEDQTAQSDDKRIPIAVIQHTENSEILKNELGQIFDDLEQWTRLGIKDGLISVRRKLEGDKKYRRLCINRLSSKYFCDFCLCTTETMYNLCHEWGLDLTLSDLEDWGKEGLFGQGGPPTVKLCPNENLTMERVHAKLRIIGGKCVGLLYEEAERIDTLALHEKLSSLDDIDKSELDIQLKQAQQSMQKDFNMLTEKHEATIKGAKEHDKITAVNRKLEIAKMYFDFEEPTTTQEPVYDDTNDVKRFFTHEKISDASQKPRPLSCSLCQKKYAVEASVTNHLIKVHKKTKQPSSKETATKLSEEQTKTDMLKLSTISEIENYLSFGTALHSVKMLKELGEPERKEVQEMLGNLEREYRKISTVADIKSVQRHEKAVAARQHDQNILKTVIAFIKDNSETIPPPKDKSQTNAQKEKKRLEENRHRRQVMEKIKECEKAVKENGKQAELRKYLNKNSIYMKYS